MEVMRRREEGCVGYEGYKGWKKEGDREVRSGKD